MWVLMLPSPVAADDAATSSAPVAARLDVATAQATEAALASIFRTQDASGALAPAEESRAVLTHPLLATMAYDAYLSTRNTAALALAANSIARYYDYLLSSADRDGDHLVETAATVRGREIRIEDPAFNALLAVDLRNLARINMELRRTLPGLYWYDTARSVERALVTTTFNVDDDYCFARDNNGVPVRRFVPAAALPVDFSMVLGDNYAEHVRAHVVDWASRAGANVEPTERAGNAIDFLAAVEVLRGGNHGPVVDALRRVMPLPSSAAVPVERYALARGRIDVPLVDDDVTFSLFLNLTRAAGFADVDQFRIEHALPAVRALALSPTPPVLSVEEGARSIGTAYNTVESLRERLRASSFFNPNDRRAFAGPDPNIATQRLLDDVTLLLHRAENRLFEMHYAAQGVTATATLVDDHVVAMDDFVVHWEVTSSGAAVRWKGLSAGVFGEAVAPVNGITLDASPGAPLRFATRYTARGAGGTLRFLTLTAVFEDADGTQWRVHFDRSIALNLPVSITARFPQGRTMLASTIPVELVLKQFAGGSDGAKYFWFSPAGLRLAEGNTGVIHFADGDSTMTTLHVEIPSPCRPGVFPFTLKFFAGDREAGTIASSFFKPYQWTFVGPFAMDGGLNRQLPPEQGVNLLETYPGPNGAARWRPVPESACDPRGGISLGPLATDRGVQYLYTIVACAYETSLPVRLWANAPAALFINGRRVATVASANGDSATATVHLNPDKNHVLIKVIGDRDARVSFSLGDAENLAADEFDNNLAELAGGYTELTAREMALGASQNESRRLITLRYEDPTAATVAVVGSFNGWSPATNQMHKNGGSWELTLSLLPGKYSYRFLVDQNKQVLDPTATGTEPDGYGGRNSVLVVNQ